MTIVTTVITSCGWVMTIVMAVVATSRSERGVFVSKNFHGRAMIIVTAMIISVGGNRNLHGLAVILITVVI